MNKKIVLNIRIERERLSNDEEVYVAVCDELNIADQGTTEEEAQENIEQAIRLWLETASENEIETLLPAIRRNTPQNFRRIEVPYGQVAGAVGS